MILQRGSRGVYVKALQVRLRDGGAGLGPTDPSLQVDGDFGPRTESAVLKAQLAVGGSQLGTPDGSLEDDAIRRLGLEDLARAIQANAGAAPPRSPSLVPGVTAESTAVLPGNYSPTTVPGFELPSVPGLARATNFLKSPIGMLTAAGFLLGALALALRGKRLGGKRRR